MNYLFKMFNEFINGRSLPNEQTEHIKYENCWWKKRKTQRIFCWSFRTEKRNSKENTSNTKYSYVNRISKIDIFKLNKRSRTIDSTIGENLFDFFENFHDFLIILRTQTKSWCKFLLKFFFRKINCPDKLFNWVESKLFVYFLYIKWRWFWNYKNFSKLKWLSTVSKLVWTITAPKLTILRLLKARIFFTNDELVRILSCWIEGKCDFCFTDIC